MPRFEAHLTAPKEAAAAIRHVADFNAHDPGWIYSEISGCPLLGKGTYCYLTSYDTDDQNLHRRLERIAADCRAQGVEPLRLKIERIIYDTRTGVNELPVSSRG